MKLPAGMIVCLALLSIAAGQAGAAEAEPDVPLKQAFVSELQKAVRTNDKNWLAGHIRYPLRYYGRQTTLIRTKSFFVRNYSSLVVPKLRVAVLAQNPARVFENWQGMMVGDGSYNIWIRNSGDGLHERYQIITINASE